MISKKFTGLAVGTALALSSAFTPAMAGAECTADDKAKIVKSRDGDIRIGDFTKSSTACLEYFAGKMSHTNLLLVADGDFQAWRDVNVEAAKQLRQEGKPTNVFFTGATDGDSTTAMTVAWGNGVERGFLPVKMKNGTKIFELAAAPDRAIELVKSKGKSVWDQYLKRPEKTASLALNQ